MTNPKTATERGLDPHWKIRIVLPNAMLHLASETEPDLIYEAGQLTTVVADWISDHDYGDTIGFIHWPAAVAITWRWSP